MRANSPARIARAELNGCSLYADDGRRIQPCTSDLVCFDSGLLAVARWPETGLQAEPRRPRSREIAIRKSADPPTDRVPVRLFPPPPPKGQPALQLPGLHAHNRSGRGGSRGIIETRSSEPRGLASSGMRAQTRKTSYPDPWHLARRALAERDVHRALNRLSSRERQLVILHSLEGWSIANAAAKVGISQRTAKEILRRGRRKLRECLIRHAQPGEPSRSPPSSAYLR